MEIPLMDLFRCLTVCLYFKNKVTSFVFDKNVFGLIQDIQPYFRARF